MNISSCLKSYLTGRPLFLSLIRAKELELFHRFMKIRHPILDVGCGDGFFAKILINGQKAKSKKQKAKKVFMDVGLDVKRSRMEEARGLNIYKKLVYYDGKNIPFKGRLFQTIVSNCVLEHVTELDALLLEIYRIVKPKGRVYLTVMAKPWENNLFGSLFLGNSYASFMKKKQQHVNLFSYIQWKQSFQRAGFTVKKCIGYLSPHACRFIDIAHYVSIPNLVSYMLFTRWVLFPKFVGLYPIDRLSRLIASDVDPLKAGALFFVLQKPLGKKIASQGQALRS